MIPSHPGVIAQLAMSPGPGALWHPLPALTAIQNWNPGVVASMWNNTVDLTVDSLGNPTGVPTAARSIALCVTRQNWGWVYQAFRPHDDVLGYYSSETDGHGCCTFTTDSGGTWMPVYQALWLPTDAQGRICLYGHPAMVGSSQWVYCLGWCDWTDTAAPGGATVFGPGAMPVVWQNLDVSALTGAVDALVWLRYQWTGGGSDRYGVRYDGDVNAYAPAWIAGRSLNVAAVGKTVSAVWYRALCCTVASGILEHQAAAAQTGQLDLLGYAPCTLIDAEVFAAGGGPMVYTTLDLTTDTSLNPTGLTGEALAIVRLTHTAGGASTVCSVRRTGDVTPYNQGASWTYSAGVASGTVGVGESAILIVSTDAAGSIEWYVGGNTWSVDLVAFIPA